MPRWQVKVKREVVTREDDILGGKRLSQMRRTVRCNNSVELSPNPPLLATIHNGDNRTLFPLRYRILTPAPPAAETTTPLEYLVPDSADS